MTNSPNARRRESRASSQANGASSSWSLDNFQVPEVEGKTRFHDLDLDPSIMRGIAEVGFEYCSPIQALVLPHPRLGADAFGTAQTGTGKTGAFVITILNYLGANPPV